MGVTQSDRLASLSVGIRLAIQAFQFNDGVRVRSLRAEGRRFLPGGANGVFGNKMGRVYPRCDTEFRIGDLAEEVRRAVLEWNADLIVTASYNPGFLGHLLGLERAPQIVKSAPCPVVVYHETQEVPIDKRGGLEFHED